MIGDDAAESRCQTQEPNPDLYPGLCVRLVVAPPSDWRLGAGITESFFHLCLSPPFYEMFQSREPRVHQASQRSL